MLERLVVCPGLIGHGVRSTHEPVQSDEQIAILSYYFRPGRLVLFFMACCSRSCAGRSTPTVAAAPATEAFELSTVIVFGRGAA